MSSKDSKPLSHSDVLAGALTKLGNLPLKARLIVESALSGMHRARLHGSSVEFAEHKEYSPGDEIRHIDWKAYAKLDRYFVKQFEQEDQLVSHLVLDASASMGYAGKSDSKLLYASYLIAALAYLLIHQRDKVGLSVFGGERIDVYVPPRGRPRHLADIYAVIDELNQRGARGAEPAPDALERLAELCRRRRALIVIASDLLSAGERALTVLRQLRAQGHDVVVFHVLDPDELEFPFHGLTMFEAMEDSRKLLVNPDVLRRQYLAELQAFLERMQRGCTDGGIEYHLVSTAQPVERTLLTFLTMRARLSAPRRAWTF